MNWLKKIWNALWDWILRETPEWYQGEDGFRHGRPRGGDGGGTHLIPLLVLLSSVGAVSARVATTITTNSGNSYTSISTTNAVYADAKIRLTFDNFTWTSATVGTNTDLSGNGNHAGAAGGVNRTNSAVPGLHGQAISAQPAAPNGYLQCRSDTTIDDLQLQGGGGMTLEFTVLFRGGSSTLFAKGASSGRWDVSMLGSGYPLGLSFTKSCATTAYVENFALNFFSNRWYHFVLTWDGGVTTNSTKLYVNGQRLLSTSVTTGAGAVNADAANNLTILTTPGNTATWSWVDGFAAWARILSQEEITLLANSSRASAQLPPTTVTIQATNILSFEGVANGTVLDTTLMGTAAKGAALGTPSITGAASDWTVVAESNLTALNPIVVAGVTYTAQTNALACRLATGSASSLNWALAASQGGNLSGCFSFKTELRQISSSGVNFDIFNVGAVANTGVAQIQEGSGGFFIRPHSISNAVTFTGASALINPCLWHDVAWLWDTNAGQFHLWVWNSAYVSLLEDSRRLILYGVSPIRANSNATFLGPINNPHGTARAGLTNYFKFFAWWDGNITTNAAMVAAWHSPFEADIRRMTAALDRPREAVWSDLTRINSDYDRKINAVLERLARQ